MSDIFYPGHFVLFASLSSDNQTFCRTMSDCIIRLHSSIVMPKKNPAFCHCVRSQRHSHGNLWDNTVDHSALPLCSGIKTQPWQPMRQYSWPFCHCVMSQMHNHDNLWDNTADNSATVLCHKSTAMATSETIQLTILPLCKVTKAQPWEPLRHYIWPFCPAIV